MADRAYLWHLTGNAFPLFFALADHAGTVPYIRTVGDPVRHHDAGDLHIFDNPAREILYRLRAVRVQRGKRLVQHQEARLDGKGPGKRDPLLLPAGKVSG